MENKQLFLVGQNRGDQWEFQGVFDSQELAVSACRDKNYWFLPITLNESWPHETVQNNDAIFPVENDSDPILTAEEVSALVSPQKSES